MSDCVKPQAARPRCSANPSWRGRVGVPGIAAIALMLSALVGAPSPALAGSFSVSPVRAQLSAEAPIASLTVRNQGESEVSIQVQTFEWTQQDGADSQLPTDALIASPAIFTIPAAGTQTLRLGLRQFSSGAVERSYRLLLRELPAPVDDSFQGLKVALALSVPVFVAPDSEPQERLEWQLQRAAEQLQLTVRNTGNVHVQIAEMHLQLGEQAKIGMNQAVYILPAQQRSWSFAAEHIPVAGTEVPLELITSRGPRNATLILE